MPSVCPLKPGITTRAHESYAYSIALVPTLELVYADQLYIGRLNPVDADLEEPLCYIVPTPKLNDIQSYFEANVCIPFTSVNACNA